MELLLPARRQLREELPKDAVDLGRAFPVCRCDTFPELQEQLAPPNDVLLCCILYRILSGSSSCTSVRF